MKRYKLINFIDESTLKSKYYKLLVLFVISLISFKVIINVSSIKKLEDYISTNKVNTNKANIESYKSLNFSDIKRIYSIIGYSNVDELIAIDNNIEIKGKCKNLNALESIKDISIIRDYSIDNIIKENDYYNFKISCKTW